MGGDTICACPRDPSPGHWLDLVGLSVLADSGQPAWVGRTPGARVGPRAAVGGPRRAVGGPGPAPGLRGGAWSRGRGQGRGLRCQPCSGRASPGLSCRRRRREHGAPGHPRQGAEGRAAAVSRAPAGGVPRYGSGAESRAGLGRPLGTPGKAREGDNTRLRKQNLGTPGRRRHWEVLRQGSWE
jgi:hypothetical protein